MFHRFVFSLTFLIVLQKYIVFFFIDIEDDQILRSLCKQITHLRVEVKLAKDYETETLSQTFALVLSLCDK